MQLKVIKLKLYITGCRGSNQEISLFLNEKMLMISHKFILRTNVCDIKVSHFFVFLKYLNMW